MFEQADSLLLHKLVHHVAEHRTHCVEPLIRLANIRQPDIIQENLLDNEDGDRLAELRTRLHDPKAKRNDLSGEKEVDDLGRIILDQRTDDAKGSQAEVLEWTRLRRRVEERIKEERNVGYWQK